VPGFDSTLAPDRPDLVLYGGIVTSLLITGIAVSLYTSRARAITLARRMTAKLRAGNERLEREIELRKQADEALRQIGIRFRAISDASPLGIFVVDADGKSHYTNPAWQRINGLTLAQSMADGWSAAIHPEDRERVLRERAAALTARAPYHNEYRLQRSDGAVIWVRVNSSAIYDEGRLLGYVGLLEDITSRRQMEETLARKTAELERSNTELQQFASVASHDLQEPLRTVTSYTQLIMRRYRDKLDSDAGEFMDYIVEGTTRMRQLIEDLLALSRVGSNAGEFTPVSTGEVLDEALAALRAVIQETDAVVHRESLPVVSADRRQLVQVFVNLIANGIKFRGEASPKIDISARANGAEWIFSIADNGIGMEPQYLERIFVIFQRLHTRSEYPGTGIGLAICKKIVERHGGRIWAESKFGAGSTFHFTIPRE
jgi:PAS domain S-box-containing protein